MGVSEGSVLKKRLHAPPRARARTLAGHDVALSLDAQRGGRERDQHKQQCRGKNRTWTQREPWSNVQLGCATLRIHTALCTKLENRASWLRCWKRD